MPATGLFAFSTSVSWKLSSADGRSPWPEGSGSRRIFFPMREDPVPRTKLDQLLPLGGGQALSCGR